MIEKKERKSALRRTVGLRKGLIKSLSKVKFSPKDYESGHSSMVI